VQACQQYCVVTPNCVAIDFNNNDLTCWAHVDPDDLLPENTYNLPNVTQYRISRTCENVTTSTSTSTSTTQSTTTGTGTTTTGDRFRTEWNL